MEFSGLGGYVCCSTNTDVSVLKPDGSTMWISQDNAWSDVVTLPTTGTYKAVFDPRGAYLRTISFQVITQPAPAVAGPNSIDGPAVSLANTLRGQVATSTFTGTAGQKVIMEFSGLGGYVCCSTNTDVSVLKPDGSTLWISQDHAWSDVVTLPTTGTYKAVFDPRGAYLRTISFQVITQPAPAVAGPNSIDGPEIGRATCRGREEETGACAGTARKKMNRECSRTRRYDSC